MKTPLLTALAACLALASAPLLAAEKVATVTASFNDVTHGQAQSTATTAAPVGTKLHDGEYLKTGAGSRAEMELSNQTITRLGANTIFNYSAANNQVDLQAGTVLFSKPKDGQQLNIKTAAVTAAILGTTGFIQIIGHGSHVSYIFGIVEGHAHANAGGHGFTVLAGQFILFTPGAPPQLLNFDIPRLVHTSELFKFHGPLPNETFIEEAIADYEDLVSEGFIKTGGTEFVLDYNAGNPRFPITGFDSSGQSHMNLIQSMMPTMGAPAPTGCSGYSGCGYSGCSGSSGGTPQFVHRDSVGSTDLVHVHHEHGG